MALRIDPRHRIEHQAKEAKETFQLISLTFTLIAAEIFFKTAERSICQIRREPFSFHRENCQIKVENPLENRLIIASCVTLTGTIFIKALYFLSIKRIREGRPYIGEYRLITWVMLFSASMMRDCFLR